MRSAIAGLLIFISLALLAAGTTLHHEKTRAHDSSTVSARTEAGDFGLSFAIVSSVVAFAAANAGNLMDADVKENERNSNVAVQNGRDKLLEIHQYASEFKADMLKDLATFHVQWERRFPSPEGANPLSAAATPAGALLAKASSKVSASEQEVEFKKLVQEQFGDDAMNHAFVEQLTSKLLDVSMQVAGEVSHAFHSAEPILGLILVISEFKHSLTAFAKSRTTDGPEEESAQVAHALEGQLIAFTTSFCTFIAKMHDGFARDAGAAPSTPLGTPPSDVSDGAAMRRDMLRAKSKHAMSQLQRAWRWKCMETPTTGLDERAPLISYRTKQELKDALDAHNEVDHASVHGGVLLDLDVIYGFGSDKTKVSEIQHECGGGGVYPAGHLATQGHERYKNRRDNWRCMDINVQDVKVDIHSPNGGFSPTSKAPATYEFTHIPPRNDKRGKSEKPLPEDAYRVLLRRTMSGGATTEGSDAVKPEGGWITDIQVVARPACAAAKSGATQLQPKSRLEVELRKYDYDVRSTSRIEGTHWIDDHRCARGCYNIPNSARSASSIKKAIGDNYYNTAIGHLMRPEAPDGCFANGDLRVGVPAFEESWPTNSGEKTTLLMTKRARSKAQGLPVTMVRAAFGKSSGITEDDKVRGWFRIPSSTRQLGSALGSIGSVFSGGDNFPFIEFRRSRIVRVVCPHEPPPSTPTATTSLRTPTRAAGPGKCVSWKDRPLPRAGMQGKWQEWKYKSPDYLRGYSKLVEAFFKQSRTQTYFDAGYGGNKNTKSWVWGKDQDDGEAPTRFKDWCTKNGHLSDLALPHGHDEHEGCKKAAESISMKCRGVDKKSYVSGARDPFCKKEDFDLAGRGRYRPPNLMGFVDDLD